MKYTCHLILLMFCIGICFAACQPEVEVEQDSDKGMRPAKEIEDVRRYQAGDIIDTYKGIPVYYNGRKITATFGRHKSEEGYNYGLKWQCVEFVKRFYYDKLDHAMPNPWGNAINFYDPQVGDGNINWDRNLRQFRNGSTHQPQLDDIIIFKGNAFNPYGHLAIISKVEERYIEIVQQNVGLDTREKYILKHKKGRWRIHHKEILGWLGKR